MISNILVALNYLADTPEVFEEALTLAEKFQANLHLFHCIQPSAGCGEPLNPRAIYGYSLAAQSPTLCEPALDRRILEVRSWLKAFVDKGNDRHIYIDADYKVGDPKVEICQAGDRLKADLIVVGRRGISGFQELINGSVSNYVMHHAHCSVMVVQH